MGDKCSSVEKTMKAFACHSLDEFHAFLERAAVHGILPSQCHLSEKGAGCRGGAKERRELELEPRMNPEPDNEESDAEDCQAASSCGDPVESNADRTLERSSCVPFGFDGLCDDGVIEGPPGHISPIVGQGHTTRD